jgi:threonine synthase
MILPICNLCGSPYPLTGTPFKCNCGGIYDFIDFPGFLPDQFDLSQPGLWKYAACMSLSNDFQPVSLGEGNTPLVDVNINSQTVWLKLEYLNPTGSYKDRGSAVLTSFLISRGVTAAVEDSSGNAGASFAAYAARAGIQAGVFIPESASGPKRKQIEAYGAKIHLIPGPRKEAAEAVLRQAADGKTYASHAYMPFGLLGIATIAYEIVEQLGGKAPGTIVAPVGHGGLIYGLIKGFEALREASVVKDEPFYVGVQAAGCAPVFDAFKNNQMTLREPNESDTIAEGVKVRNPIRGEAILQKFSGNKGKIIAIEDDKLLLAYNEIAKKGFFVEPTSALVWAALPDIIQLCPGPIVLVLTGTGYKTQI